MAGLVCEAHTNYMQALEIGRRPRRVVANETEQPHERNRWIMIIVKWPHRDKCLSESVYLQAVEPLQEL